MTELKVAEFSFLAELAFLLGDLICCSLRGCGMWICACHPHYKTTDTVSVESMLCYFLLLSCYFLYSQKYGCYIRQQLVFSKTYFQCYKTAFFHLRNIVKLQNMLPVSDAEKLVHALMTSRLDYCNALLGPASSINKLQIEQNAAARVLTRSRKYDHITPILQSLH